MLSEELLRKVRLIEITTRRVVNDVMSGQYRSHFKGHGVQFSEHRLYIPGDDIRHIDWKVSARSRDPLVKKYEEERELTVLLIVDVSGSESFGSTQKTKSEILAEIGGMLAYAASHTGDKVGVLLFGGQVEKILPPKKGRSHVQRVISELLTFKPKNPGTNLDAALQSAERVMKHGGIIFILSDFLAAGYETSLKRLARKHDVVAVRVRDERERQVPNVGSLLLFDPETGEDRWVDTGSYAFKKWIESFKKNYEAQVQSALKPGIVEVLNISTQEDYGEAVVKFFKARALRRR